MKKNILIVGTGTIGEPLIGLLTSCKEKLGIENVYFYKRTPLQDEYAKVESMCSRGARLVAKDAFAVKEFEKLGHSVEATFPEALNLVDVVIDCTPAGNHNKNVIYLGLDKQDHKRRTFIAQGSEKGFGVPYAYGINDDMLKKLQPRFIQVVSCNTHNIACLLRSLSDLGETVGNVVMGGDFVCIRRANDVSQDGNYIASPVVSGHDDPLCGTHHATDVIGLFETLGMKFQNGLFSSALKINSQYMHVIRFNITLRGEYSRDDVLKTFSKNKFIALTYRKSVNRVFSFGRDHGFYGRIYNHTVLPVSSLSVRNVGTNTSVTGFCFTPQDGNSLLSSAAAAMYAIHGDAYGEYMENLDNILHDVI